MITCTGTIKASDINTELGRTPSSIFHLDGADERSLAGKPSGLIKFSDFYCKSLAFNMTIGLYNVVVNGGLQLTGFSATPAGNLKFGTIEGANPTPLYPAGYGGADVPFYFIRVGTGYGNNSGYKLIFTANTSNPTDDKGSLIFGNSLHIKYVFADNTTYEFDLTASDNGNYIYQGIGASNFHSQMRSRKGQSCKVTIRRN